MAIYQVDVLLQDAEGRQTTRGVLFDVADEAALLVDAAAFITDYQAMTKCGVISYNYRRAVEVNNTPAAGSNIDPGATFLMNSTLTIDPTVKVPDPVEAIKDGSGGIDLADLIVTDWFANYNPGTARVNKNSPTQPTSIRRGTLDK